MAPTFLVTPESELECKLRQCLLSDISLILSDFMAQQQQQTFAKFKESWDRLDFELVHLGRPEEVSYTWFMNCLFDETLDIMEKVKEQRWACAYLLYFLHQTQPFSHPIHLSLRKWDLFLEVCKQSEELRAIWCILQEQDGLCLTAMTRKEVLDSYAAYLLRQQEDANPVDLFRSVEKDLTSLQQSFSSSRTLIEPDYLKELGCLESEYARAKHAVEPFVNETVSLAKPDLSKDLSQSQRDWASKILDIGGEVNGKRKFSQRRSTITEVPTRPSTAPPITEAPSRTATPPDYIIHAEHMPSLL